MRRLAALAARPRVCSALCAVWLFLLPLALFAQVTLGDRTLIPADNLFQFQPYRDDAAQLGVGLPQNELLSDLVLQNYAWKRFIRESLAQGELPLWNPYLFAGVPFLAAGQHSALYPFSLLYYVLPLERAFAWFTVMQLALAGISMYALVRTYHMRRSSATLAGTAFQLSGFMIAGVVHPMIIAAAAWMPLILALCERVMRQDTFLRGRPASLPWAALGALAIGCHVLAGHIEITVYTALITALYCACRLLQISRQLGGKVALGRLGWLMAMGGAGALIAAIQLAPLYELVTRNFRGAGRSTLDQVRSYAYPSRYILMWLLPNLFGNPAHHAYFDLFTWSWQPLPAPQGSWWGYAAKQYVESAVYVGLLPLVLAASATLNTALRAVRRTSAPTVSAPTLFFVVYAAACVLFMFGTPAYAILYYGLPGINQLHSPYRWNIPFTVCVCVLAAIGFEQLLAARDARWARRISVVALCCGSLLALGGVLSTLAWPALAERIISAYRSANLAAERFPTPEAFFSFLAGNISLFGGTLALTALALLLMLRRLTSARWLLALPVLALGLDLGLSWRGFNPAVEPRLLAHRPAALAFLSTQTRGAMPARITSFEPRGVKTANANMLWLFDLHDIRGYDSIIPKQYADYMRAIEAQDDLLYNRIAPLYQRASLESPLLDLLGVRFVLTEDSIDTPGYALAFEQPGMRIYENTRAMPRVYRSSDVALVASSSFSQTIQQFDPRRVLIVDSCPREQRCDLSAAAARELPIPGNDAVEITVDKASEIWIDVQQTADDQWLVLNDSYFPGWRAWIRPRGAGNEREVETQIVRVNGNFRAVRLGPRIGNGEQTQALTVRFRYSPDSLRFGGFVSGLSVLGVLFALLIFGWRSLARDADSLSGAQRVARNSAVLSLMNIAGRLIAFASAIVIARIIGASGLGAYGTAVVLIGPFEILMNFGLNTWLTRQVAQDKPNAGAYFGFTTRLRLMLSALVVPLLLLLGLILFQAGYFDRSVALAFAILGVSQVISSVNTGLSALFFAFERGEIPAALSFFGALLTAALGVALLLTGIGIIALALTSILVNLVTLSVLSWQAWRTLGVQLTASAAGIPQSQRGLLREALPLMLNHLIPSIEYQLDVPLLKAAQPPALFFSGAGSPVSADSVAGWYYTGYRYLNAFNIVPSFFTQSFFPAMSRMAAQDGDALRVAFTLAVKLLVMLALPLAIAMTFLANWMAGIFGADFLPHAAVAVAIIGWSMVPGWINSLTNYALIAVNKQQLLIRAFVVTLIFNAIANLLVIPVYSYIGAAIVTIVSEIVKGAVFYYFVHQHLAQVNWVRVLAKPALAGAAMAAIAAGFMSIAQPLLGVLVGAAGYGVMLLALRAFDASELAILKPLVRRGK